MSIKIANTEFDSVEYDARGDVLYLSVGPPSAPDHTLATVEGHAIDYDGDNNVVGMVLLNVQWALQRDGELHVTLPERCAVASRRDLEPVLA